MSNGTRIEMVMVAKMISEYSVFPMIASPSATVAMMIPTAPRPPRMTAMSRVPSFVGEGVATILGHLQEALKLAEVEREVPTALYADRPLELGEPHRLALQGLKNPYPNRMTQRLEQLGPGLVELWFTLTRGHPGRYLRVGDLIPHW